MKFLRSTLAGGLLFLVPVVVFVIIIEKALALIRKITEPIAEHLPRESIIGLRPAMLLAIVLLVLMCFLAGVFARTKLARRIVDWLETTILSNLPGYEFLRSLGESILGTEKAETRQVVLAHLDDAWQLGFLMERLDNGLMAIFVPDAPNPRSGSVVFMEADHIAFVDISQKDAMKCLKRTGIDSNALLGKIAKP